MEYIIPLNLVEIEAGNYHLTVDSRFDNGTEGIWIIDTGASKTVFDQSLTALYHKIENDEENLIQSAGIGASKLETTLGNLLPFYMADFRAGSMQVALLDLSHINKLYFHATEKEICGLIGGDFLLQHTAVIDYGNHTMILKI
jgi:hypothetical protein